MLKVPEGFFAAEQTGSCALKPIVVTWASQGLLKGMDPRADVAALAGDSMGDSGDEAAADDDVPMDMGADGAAPVSAARPGKHKYTQQFKDKILALLEESGFADKRSAKLNQDEFMQLLAAFNSRGIHFA